LDISERGSEFNPGPADRIFLATKSRTAITFSLILLALFVSSFVFSIVFPWFSVAETSALFTFEA